MGGDITAAGVRMGAGKPLLGELPWRVRAPHTKEKEKTFPSHAAVFNQSVAPLSCATSVDTSGDSPLPSLAILSSSILYHACTSTTTTRVDNPPSLPPLYMQPEKQGERQSIGEVVGVRPVVAKQKIKKNGFHTREPNAWKFFFEKK